MVLVSAPSSAVCPDELRLDESLVYREGSNVDPNFGFKMVKDSGNDPDRGC